MNLPELTFDERGLIPVVAQDAVSGEVLTLAYANREAIEKTLETGEAHYYSRSRDELWHKGATSGNIQKVKEIRFDCDADALLYRLEPHGPACHTGEGTCFYRAITDEASPSLGQVMALLENVIEQRLRDLPEGSYVTKMHRRGLGYISQKVVEEAGESIVAALEHKDGELISEAADLLFHLTMLLHERGLGWQAVMSELLKRHQR